MATMKELIQVSKMINYKFYDEREWRYKPSRFLTGREFLTKEEYQDEKIRNEANDSMGFLSFGKDDITDIICPGNEVDNIRAEIFKIEKLKGINLKIIDTLKNKTI